MTTVSPVPTSTRRADVAPAPRWLTALGWIAPIACAATKAIDIGARAADILAVVALGVAAVLGVDVDASELTHQQLHVRRRVMVSEPRSDVPMPVGQGTVPPSVPESQNHPRQRGGRHGRQVPPASAPPDPAKTVEGDPRGVEHEERYVQRLVHTAQSAARASGIMEPAGGPTGAAPVHDRQST